MKRLLETKTIQLPGFQGFINNDCQPAEILEYDILLSVSLSSFFCLMRHSVFLVVFLT